MSTTISQIIEVRIDGQWKYVPVATHVTDTTDALCKYGSVRDFFAHKWYGVESFIHYGVPEDISKRAREAMIYQDEDFINSNPCWIDLSQYEAFAEKLREQVNTQIEKLVQAKIDTKITKRLDNLESMLKDMRDGQKKSSKKTSESECDSEEEEDYIREELEDIMWAWSAAESNIAEIEAYAQYMSDQEAKYDDIRVIMYVS